MPQRQSHFPFPFYFPIPDRCTRWKVGNRKAAAGRRGEWASSSRRGEAVVSGGWCSGSHIESWLSAGQECATRARSLVLRQNCWNLIPQGLLQRAALHNASGSGWRQSDGGGGVILNMKWKLKAALGWRLMRSVCFALISRRNSVELTLRRSLRSSLPLELLKYFGTPHFAFNSPSDSLSLTVYLAVSLSAAARFMTHHHKNASIKCAVHMPPQLPHPPTGPRLLSDSKKIIWHVYATQTSTETRRDATRRHWRHSKLPPHANHVWRLCK